MKSSKSQDKLIGGNIIDHINQRKKQLEEYESNTEHLLKEAMARALSGGRPNSMNKFMQKMETNNF